MPWVYDPQSGGVKITLSKQTLFLQKAEAFERTRPWFPSYELKLQFKEQFCYVKAKKAGEKKALPLCRLRYFRENIGSMAIYSYSNERYEPCYFRNGTWEGSLEEAIEMGEMYLS